MKILYHHRTAAGDGQRVHITEMVAAFKRMGHEVIVVGPATGADNDFKATGGLIAAIRHWLPAFVGELLELAYSLRAYQKLRAAIRLHRPDALYERANLFLLAGMWASKTASIPYLLEVNAPLTEERSRHGNLGLKALARWSEEKTWRSADVVLPVTDVLKGYITRAGVNAGAVHVIHNGIRLEDYPAPTRKVGSNVTLGFIGFVRDWHGLDRIIDMLPDPDFKDVNLEIAGDGPALEGLKAQASVRGVTDRVHFKGLVARADVPKVLYGWDIALQPAVTPYASPLKLFEYMAAGLAILAPDQDNIREVLTDDENARLFGRRPDDRQSALRGLIIDQDTRIRFGDAARQTVIDTPHTWDGNAARVTAIIDQLLSK